MPPKAAAAAKPAKQPKKSAKRLAEEAAIAEAEAKVAAMKAEEERLIKEEQDRVEAIKKAKLERKRASLFAATAPPPKPELPEPAVPVLPKVRPSCMLSCQCKSNAGLFQQSRVRRVM
jgi:hypothetical protein